MERTKFFEHYQICTRKDGTPREVRRSGAAIHYKAIDNQNHGPVMLQLIPIATVDESKRDQFEEQARSVQKLEHLNVARVLDVVKDDDHIGVVSEYVEGENTEAWLVEHGPMEADAVLRIGLQVVRALNAATFHGLAHRAIQPSNIVIVPGQNADGGWPLVKLINFGLNSSEYYSPGSEAGEIASAGAPQFSSPEQLLNKPIDFRSEIYSLGATLCFLLTGAVPLAASGMKVRLRARRLPELRRAPTALRKLLVHMLQENPTDRPHDPVAFESEMRDCLTNIERRQAIGRKLGIPLAAVIPRKTRQAGSTLPLPMKQVLQGTLAFAALLVAGAVVAAFLLPEDKVPFLHRKTDQIGVAVGVPEASSVAVAPAASPAAIAQAPLPVPAASAAAPSPQQTPPITVVEQPVNTSPPVSEKETSATPPTVAANSTESGEPETSPEPPAAGPRESDRRVESHESQDSRDSGDTAIASKETNNSDSNDSDETASASSPVESKPTVTRKIPNVATTRRSTSSRSRTSHVPNERGGTYVRFPTGTAVRAKVVATLPDGRAVLKLPSGRTVVGQLESGSPPPRRVHRRVVIDRGDAVEPAPYQPFDPESSGD